MFIRYPSYLSCPRDGGQMNPGFDYDITEFEFSNRFRKKCQNKSEVTYEFIYGNDELRYFNIFLSDAKKTNGWFIADWEYLGEKKDRLYHFKSYTLTKSEGWYTLQATLETRDYNA